jgi:hypothetical protein
MPVIVPGIAQTLRLIQHLGCGMASAVAVSLTGSRTVRSPRHFPRGQAKLLAVFGELMAPAFSKEPARPRFDLL